jgi:Family of unknown function (DUF5709)
VATEPGRLIGMSDSGTFGDSVYEGGDAVDDAEDLDPIENLTGDDPDEAMQTGYSPPDREPYTLKHAHTAEEELDGIPLDERLRQEEPDVSPSDLTGDEEPRAGRLVAPDEGAHPDEEKDEVATDVGPAGYASSAEEAAVHIRSADAEG